MKKNVIRALLFEDNPGDVRLFREFLHEDGLAQVELDQVDRLKTGLERLAQKRPDVILLDLGLPDCQGLETFARVFAQAPEVPIVVLTGLNDAEQAVEAVTAGAQDYLVKGEVSGGLLVRAIRYSIERKRTEESLRDSNSLNTMLLQTIPFGMDIVNEAGQVLFLDTAFEELVGKNSLGNRCWDLYKDDKQQCKDCPLKREVDIGITKTIETSGVLGGKVFEISHTGIIFQGQKAILEVFHDITERKQVEDEIRQLNIELEQRVAARTVQLELSNKELEAFAYSVSHDLRAPLRAIDGFSRIIVDDYAEKLDSEGNRLLNVIRSNTAKMDHLITDLLALSRATRIELKFSRVDMATMTNSIYHEVSTPEVREQITFSIFAIPDAYGDPNLLRQVWTNLLSNAIKYTGPKDERRIEVGSYRENEMNVYFVKDNGVGFNPEYTHKLFGVFQRLHKSEDFEGTGVGLAIVQRIIQRHGGNVWGEGQLNQGATFYFSLPPIVGDQL